MNNLSVFEAIKKSVENDKIFFDKKQRKDIVQLANSPRKKKAAMNKIIEIANDIVYGPDCDIDNSIINCAWCGPVSENTRFELSDSGVGCYIKMMNIVILMNVVMLYILGLLTDVIKS